MVAIVVALLVVLAACRPSQAPFRTAPAGRVFMTEQIARFHARNALEAVDYALRGTAASQLADRDGTPILLVLDGLTLRDPAPLVAIPAMEIVSITVLSRLDATTLYGPRGGSGAVLIRTGNPVR